MTTSPSLRSLKSCVTAHSPETEVPVRGDEQVHQGPARQTGPTPPAPVACRAAMSTANGRRTSDVCTWDISKVARMKAVSLPVRKTANLAWTC